MSAKAVQRRRGTTAEHSVFTGLDGELTVDIDKKTVVVHDGSTVGGSPLTPEVKTKEVEENSLAYSIILG